MSNLFQNVRQAFRVWTRSKTQNRNDSYRSTRTKSVSSYARFLPSVLSSARPSHLSFPSTTDLSPALILSKAKEKPQNLDKRMLKLESAVVEIQRSLNQNTASPPSGPVLDPSEFTGGDLKDGEKGSSTNKRVATRFTKRSSDFTQTSSASTVLPLQTLQAVVKIFCTTSHPNFMLPWQRKQQTACFGSGFILDITRKLIITNSHVILSATFIEVRRHGESTKYTAEIVYIAADCDLALLSVADEGFWNGISELNVEGAMIRPRYKRDFAKERRAKSQSAAIYTISAVYLVLSPCRRTSINVAESIT